MRASRRLRYDRMRDFPEGLLVLGDAYTSFNPVFGQGITVAALEGVCLDACLARRRGNLARQFLPRAQKIIEVPWSIAANSDLRFPGVDGKRPIGLKLLHAYLARINRAGAHDPVVALTLLEVINLARSQAALLQPAFVARVLLSGGAGGAGASDAWNREPPLPLTPRS